MVWQSRNDERRGPAERRYNELKAARQPYLDRARECAALTIPYLMPPEGREGMTLPSLYQSVGANGVTNLAAKLLLTMLPPNEPCFRLRVNNLLAEADGEEEDKEFRTKVEKALSRIEQAVLADIEAAGDRPVVNEGNQHLIVAGNVLYHDDPKKGLRMFPLSNYVTRRDPAGTPVEIIVEETVDIDVLPEGFREAVLEASREPDARPGESSLGGKGGLGERGRKNREARIYTHLTREPELWRIYQECRGMTVPGTEGTYKIGVCPWFPVRMYSIAGEDYGRSFTELQKGDLTSLESLSQALVEGSAVSAKVVFLVPANGQTSARALAEAANGDVIEGAAGEVGVMQVQKHMDFQVVSTQMQRLEMRLKAAFLMMDGVRRDAERVTAEEIRLIAQELETGLGGVYTVISQEFQLPYINSRMDSLASAGRIPKLPKGVVQPSVVTGFEALGRGNDKAKLVEFLQTGTALFGAGFFSMVNPQNALVRLASSMGIPTEGLVKDAEELAREQAAAKEEAEMTALVEKLGPEALRQIGASARGAGSRNAEASGNGAGTPRNNEDLNTEGAPYA